MKNSLVFGSTGATGKAIVDLLCGGKISANYIPFPGSFVENFHQVQTTEKRYLNAFTRRDYDFSLNQGKEYFGNFQFESSIIDFENLEGTLKPKLENLIDKNGPIDTVFYVLGTTRALAGSSESFYHIDHDYTIEIAKILKSLGVIHFSLLSSAMVNSQSSLLYSRTKGKIIEDIKEIEFERFSVFKPGLFVPYEKRPDSRFGETVGFAFDPFFGWISRTFGIKILQSIKVQDLAASMIINALRVTPEQTNGYEEYETAPDILALMHKKD